MNYFYTVSQKFSHPKGFYYLGIQQKLFTTFDIDIHICLMKEIQKYERNLNHTKVL